MGLIHKNIDLNLPQRAHDLGTPDLGLVRRDQDAIDDGAVGGLGDAVPGRQVAVVAGVGARHGDADHAGAPAEVARQAQVRVDAGTHAEARECVGHGAVDAAEPGGGGRELV